MDELRKLRWQCRRGMLELDLILEKYLDTKYVNANEEERAQFRYLLSKEDSDLLELLMEGKLIYLSQHH